MKFMETVIFVIFLFFAFGFYYFLTPIFLYLLGARPSHEKKDRWVQKYLKGFSLLLEIPHSHFYITKRYPNQFFVLDYYGLASLVCGSNLYQSLNEDEIADLILLTSDMIKSKTIKKNNLASLIFLPLHLIIYLSEKIGYLPHYLMTFLAHPFLLFEFKMLAGKKKLLIVKRKHFNSGHESKRFNALLYKMELYKNDSKGISDFSLSSLGIIPSFEENIFQKVYGHQKMDVYFDEK